MADTLLIFISACLVNNLVLDQLIGICPGAALSRKIEVAVGLSLVTVVAVTLAALVSYPISHYLLRPLGLPHLELISFVLVIVAVILIAAATLERIWPALREMISVFIPLTLVNCSALGVALLNVEHTHGFTGSLFFGLGAGAGFGLVITMTAALHERLLVADVPQSFQGAGVLLMTLGILSMAFMGFTGLTHL